MNILTHRNLRRENNDCVLRFFSFLLFYDLFMFEITACYRNFKIILTAFQSEFEVFFVFLLCYNCIRQHDVNILMQSFLEKRRDDCVLCFLFFSSNYQKLSSSENKQITPRQFCHYLVCVFLFVIVCYNGRRKHDVNILTQSFLEKRRDVCVLRFFSSFSSSSQPTS